MSRLILSMSLVFLCGILSAATSIKVESVKCIKKCSSGDQVEMSIILDDLKTETCEITVFIQCENNCERLGTITCREGRNLGKWLISKEYEGKDICFKFVSVKENIEAYSKTIKIEKNKPKE